MLVEAAHVTKLGSRSQFERYDISMATRRNSRQRSTKPEIAVSTTAIAIIIGQDPSFLPLSDAVRYQSLAVMLGAMTAPGQK